MLDLNVESFPDFDDDVQKNLKKINQFLGNIFVMVYNNIYIPCNLSFIKEKYNDDSNYFILKYNSNKRTTNLLPFKIVFVDPTNFQINNCCYISNIHKTNKLSGTQIMKIILRFLQIINVEKVYIYDDTTVLCTENVKMDLSFFKLIEKGVMFYQRFGFKLTVDEHGWQKLEYKDSDILEKILDKYVYEFKNIKIKILIDKYSSIIDILTQVILKQDYENLKIYINDKDSHISYPSLKIRNKVMSLIIQLDRILDIFSNSNFNTLAETLVHWWYEDCNVYTVIMDYIVLDPTIQIEYHSKVIKLEYRLIIDKILDIRTRSIFVLDFN